MSKNMTSNSLNVLEITGFQKAGLERMLKFLIRLKRLS